MGIKSELMNLIASGDVKNAIGKLLWYAEKTDQNDLYSSMILLSGRYNRNRKSESRGTISSDNFNMELNRITNSFKEYIESDLKDTGIKTDGYKPDVDDGDSGPNNDQKTVFISYSHSEVEIAKKMKASLEALNVKVIIDFEALIAGNNIDSFIDNSIGHASNTIAIISSNSLHSSWVSKELIKSITVENIANKKFIAAYIDDSFFKRSFTGNALDKIEIEIKDINEEIDKRKAKGRNTDDLDKELKRYKDLEYHLPAIIERLNESYSVDIRDGVYETGIKSIYEALI